MPVSEAQLAANRRNAQKSSGPVTAEGKAISRQNGLKHGLSGEGIVVPEEDQEEIAHRVEAFMADMKPRSPGGAILIEQMAKLSVREERACQQESFAIAQRVRHAAEDFDEERFERANTLFDGLADDPRNNLRKLKRMPEGVDRLIDAWGDLRAGLCNSPKPVWTAAELELAANMTGLKSEFARGSRWGALSRGFWGDFDALSDAEGGNLDEEFRQEWAKAMLLERIDAEIASLQAHRETLDFEMIELDRAEAGGRALFDPSREAALARRYESEARRGFYKALTEFRKVEAESLVKAEAAPTRPSLAKMGSSCQPAPSPIREPRPGAPGLASAEVSDSAAPKGQPSRPIPPVKKSG
jgi:hypothetical protein